MTDLDILLGGISQPSLPGRIAAGQHPAVDYVSLAERYSGQIISFDDLNTCNSRVIRWVSRRTHAAWATALLAKRRDQKHRAVVTTGEDVGLPLALLQRLSFDSTPLGIIIHGSYFGSKKMCYILHLLQGLRGLRLLCLSSSLQRQLTEQYGFPAQRVHNTSYGVDTHFFSPGAPGQLTQIASAGMANRDYQTLVNAVRTMDITLKIAADSAWFRTDLRISAADLPPNVEARSYGDYVGLRQLYADSAFVVVPLYEAVHACGYAVIVEAMAMGKPVITTDIIGRSDFILEGETGYYVPPEDSKALAERIQYLLDRPELIRTMGLKARKLVVEKYSMESYVSRIAAAMEING